MGTSYRFLATVDEAVAVVDWFRALPEPPVESPRSDGVLLYFRSFGPLNSKDDSPLVGINLPVRARGVLTSIGEVNFLATPMTRFPQLNRVAQQFRKWLFANPRVYSHRRDFVHEWDYYLEGTSKNWDGDIYALPNGMTALRRGEYFIAHHDLSGSLDLVCRKLELRDVQGILPA